MDCGWRNPERVTYSYLERQKLPASKADCIEGADQPQTSGRRDALTQFAMMISIYSEPLLSPFVEVPAKRCNFILRQC